ncbi:MAG: arginine--tRNA ligase [Deltaproteobacteria bacterium]|nr:arginine--tRNA ligase [Deltaproteobacteria bacterium]
MRIEHYLDELAAEAIMKASGVAAPALLRRAKDPSFGDYQINGVMPLAKIAGKPPRELARSIAENLASQEAISRAEVAGPGFINLHLSLDWICKQLRSMGADAKRDGVPLVEKADKIVVDFSSPNIAKQMHVGHLRSTIIGDALIRLLRFVGHEVIGDNHLGDWGTQFGLLIVGMRRFGSRDELKRNPIEELGRIYKLANAAAKQDEAVADQARLELAKLQAGDGENREIWKSFLETSRVELERIYGRLGVSFDTWLGESFYQDMLDDVVADLVKRGIAREDGGAVCVFFDDISELAALKTPLIVQKKDGAFLYATTDIATALYRRDHLLANRVLYVVDQRQSLHFRQLFAVMAKLGVTMRLEHIGFGSVLGTDNKPLKTREGNLISLSELLDRAEERAAERMRCEGLNLSAQQISDLAPIVGIGAIKYVDLQQNRLSDYQFDWDKMISFKGNSGPYLQYAHARIQAVFRKGGIEPKSLMTDTPLYIEHDTEIALAKQLICFADTIHQAAETSYPHLICDHLYSLARLFSSFYEQCPVLKAEPKQRTTRLLLSSIVSRQIKRGLALLGIEAPNRM